MTEDQIEIKVEKMTDRLDKSFMSGAMSQEEYDAEIRAIDNWATDQYRHIRSAPFKDDFLHYE